MNCEMLKPWESMQEGSDESGGRGVADNVKRQLSKMAGTPRWICTEEVRQDVLLDGQINDESLDATMLHQSIRDCKPGGANALQGGESVPIEGAGRRQYGRRHDGDACTMEDIEDHGNGLLGHINTQVMKPMGEVESFCEKGQHPEIARHGP